MRKKLSEYLAEKLDRKEDYFRNLTPEQFLEIKADLEAAVKDVKFTSTGRNYKISWFKLISEDDLNGGKKQVIRMNAVYRIPADNVDTNIPMTFSYHLEDRIAEF